MADLKGRYPLATADGQSIPLDVVRPNGCIEKTFATGASTAAMDVPAAIDVFSIFATEDCIIKFATSAASAAALTDGVFAADTMKIVAGLVTFLSPPIGKRSFALRAVSANGVATINFYENWSGLSLSSQPTRR
jgi:hypothetical protein